MMSEDIWIQHLGQIPSSFLFPRKIGNPRQVMVKTRDAYLRGVTKLWDRSDLYVALFSEYQKDLQLYHTLFIDFDAHNGDSVFNDLESECYELYYWFKRKWKGVPRMVHSGRGYHLYFDFPIHLFEDYRTGVINFYQYLQEHFNFNFLDRRVYNQNKIVRLPNTLNIKADKMAVWINRGEEEPSFRFGSYLDGLSNDPPPLIQNDNEVVDPLGDLDLLMAIAPDVTDGRRVLLWQVIMPRLRLLNKNFKYSMEWCLNWVNETGVDPYDYQIYISSQYNVPTFPYKWATFFHYNPEMKYLKEFVDRAKGRVAEGN